MKKWFTLVLLIASVGIALAYPKHGEIVSPPGSLWGWDGTYWRPVAAGATGTLDISIDTDVPLTIGSETLGIKTSIDAITTAVNNNRAYDSVSEAAFIASDTKTFAAISNQGRVIISIQDSSKEVWVSFGGVASASITGHRIMNSIEENWNGSFSIAASEAVNVYVTQMGY